jgi:hypothetical protein
VITAPLMLVEMLLADTDREGYLVLRHPLGGAAVLPLTIAAMTMHMGVYSVSSAIRWLLILPTPLLILVHFLLEAGAAVPHALVTLPRRLMRAWLSLPLVILIAWGATTVVAEFGRRDAARQYQPLQNLMSFAVRIDFIRERVLGGP